MKKLTLDQLEVGNFAIKLSEKEISNAKGGTITACMLSTYLAPPIPGTNGNISTPSWPACKSLIPTLLA